MVSKEELESLIQELVRAFEANSQRMGLKYEGILYPLPIQGTSQGSKNGKAGNSHPPTAFS